METLRGYDLWSQSYDTFDNPLIAMTEHALDHAPWEVRGSRVLELGCGTGRNVPRLLALGARSYLGVDGSEGMLEQGRRTHTDPRISWRRADLSQPLPLADASADRVLVTLVLEHLPRLEALFLEIHRVLAPGGVCRFLEIHSALVETGTHAHFWSEGVEYHLPSFPHSSAELTDSLRASGFQAVSVREWSVTEEAERRCAKLVRHRGKPVLLEVASQR